MPNAKDVAEKVYVKALPEVVTTAAKKRTENEKKIKEYPDLKKKLAKAEAEVERLKKAAGGAPPSADNV